MGGIDAPPGSATYNVLHYGCPAIGGAIALVMFLTPMRAVLAVNRRRYLGVRIVLCCA
jgi:hypothetical protein